ncbi:MAG: hypothetical protein ACR5LA_13090 [Wolbachia sp.]
MSSTGMTPFAVQFTFKNECSYSYVLDTGIQFLIENVVYPFRRMV